MLMKSMTRIVALPVIIAVSSLASQRAYAEDAAAEDAAEPRAVELFAAMEAGDIDVQIIPRDASESNILIQNNTDQPLSIQMPEAFAGAPVLAQFQPGGGGGFGQGGGLGAGGGGSQGVGGGFGGNQGGGGFFNIGPQRERRIRVQTVCLEHGLADPNPHIAYKLIPISEFTQDSAVIEVCKMLGRGELDQATAQAAAWNLTDDLSWNALANKVRVRRRFGADEYYFSHNQIRNAIRAVNQAKRHAEDSEEADKS